MGVITNIFYLDTGYTKSQIATYTKLWGLVATIAGGFVGGVLSVRYGIIRILFVGALLSAATNFLFAYVAGQPPDELLLLMVIVADNVSAGLAAAAFVAYLSSLTSVSFTAMQYALFSSIMTLFPKILAGYSGGVVDSIGYEWFFIGTALIGIPVLFLVIWAGKVNRYDQ
jgi:PAT family beta-lactamase induction signal transducer AmpG